MNKSQSELKIFLYRIQSFRLQIITAVAISNILYLVLLLVFAVASNMNGIQAVLSALVGGVIVFSTNAICISAYASTYRTRLPIPIPDSDSDALKQGDFRFGGLSFSASTASFILIVISFFVFREAKPDILHIGSLVDFHSSGFASIVYTGLVLPLAPAFAVIFSVRQAERITEPIKHASNEKGTATDRTVGVKNLLKFWGSWLTIFAVTTWFVFLGAYVLNHFPAFDSTSSTQINLLRTGIGYDWIGLIYGSVSTTTTLSLLSGYIVGFACGRFATKQSDVGGNENRQAEQG